MIKQIKPLVTIAIPTYNRGDGYLKQALGSALRQTYQNIEIIVSDNCSTDNTDVFIKTIKDPRLRYFRQRENVKPNDNFNFCLEQAKGDYFLLLHDDDKIDDDFVSTCMKAANNEIDLGIIRTGMRRINSDGEVLRERLNLASGLSTVDFFLSWFRGKTPMHLCMSLFNTKNLRDIGGFNSKHQLFQDVLAEVKLAAMFGRLDIKEIKASYRMHSAQFSGSAKMKAWCEDSFLLLHTMCNLISEKKALFEKRGKAFFFRHNYNLAKNTKFPLDRFRSYFIVFKNFGYFYSVRQQIKNFFYRKFFKVIRFIERGNKY